MLKGKVAVLCLVAMSLLVVNGTAFAGIIDPCESTASIVFTSGTPNCNNGTEPPPIPAPCAAAESCAKVDACPQGDGSSFVAQGWYIAVTVVETGGIPIPNITPTDFWLLDCDAPASAVILCGGSASSGADSLTNSSGMTTLSQTTLAASVCGVDPTLGPSPTYPCGGGLASSPGGPLDGMKLIVQGFAIQDAAASCADQCLPVLVRSYDLNTDGQIGGGDLGLFSLGFPVPITNPYNECTDYNQDGQNSLGDLGLFSVHFGFPAQGLPGHCCSPPCVVN